MTDLLMDKSTSIMNCVYMSRYLHRLFTYWLVFVTFLSSLERANSAKDAVVSRLAEGDGFTNLFDTNRAEHCANVSAHCSKSVTGNCGECVCNSGSETYRTDIKKCVSMKNLETFTGCQYRGIKDANKGYMDTRLPMLNFIETGSKKIRGQTIHRGIATSSITCEIENKTSYLNSRGEWVALPVNISDILRISVEDGYGKIERYFFLDWEKHGDSFYFGLLIKLHVSCRTNADYPYSGCFVFKSKGHKSFDTSSLTTTTKKMSGPSLKTTELKPTKKLPTVGSTTEMSSTRKSVVNKSYTYNVPMAVIIGVSAGVGLVILIIIILAICFVRYRTRKHTKEKPSIVNAEAPPKVHFTAQARFSLIQEAAPVYSDEEDYTSLKENRESYDPYWSLQKDDVDLNVINTVLKDAISMESMNPSSEPRYRCHLTKDNAIVIESAEPRSSIQPKYHVLEVSDDAVEPDYEEVDDYDTAMASSRLLETKPPLPEREYHELEPPSERLHSEC